MRYLALCADYDGTLAQDGQVPSATREALERLRASGRRLVLVTGRELPDLQSVCPHLHLFDSLVLENGALLYDPARAEERLLAEPPPPSVAETLRQRGVTTLAVGRVILATWETHETILREVLREQNLPLELIFNKRSVMVLPRGIDKASGLATALNELGLAPHQAVAVGDAENDLPFLRMCGCSVAVANALPAVKEVVDLVTRADHGAGVVELIDRLLANDLSDLSPQSAQR